MNSPTATIDLSPREHQVLKLLANDHSNAEIADLLFVSLRSVEKYRAALREKLECSNLDELLECAREQQLVD